MAYEKHRIWRIGKYIRLSREDGNTESESVTNQRKILDEQIPGFFQNDGYEITDEYIDDGRTGTSNDTRPGFLRLIEDVKSGRVNCIVTKNLSRAFRNSANQGKFLEEFIPLYDTRFISLYEPHIDTFLNPEVVHSLEVSITGFLNEQYAYKTSVDIRRTFETKRKKGEFIGAFAPYGYRKSPEDKNSLLIDDGAARVVRDIYRWFVEDGMSKNGIAKRLNELGVPNPASYKRQHGFKYRNPKADQNDGLWSDKTVRNILLNEVYIGNMVQGRQKVISYKVHDRVATDKANWYIVENTHEAVVSKEAFNKAQRLHQRDTRAAPKETKVHLFAGLVRCADCGKAMTRKSAKGTVYFHCSTYARKSKTLCSKHTIREDQLTAAVLAAIRKQIDLVDTLPQTVNEINSAPVVQTESKRIESLLVSKKQELDKITNVTDSLYMDWRSGEITKEEYRRMKAKFEGQIEHFRNNLEQLQNEKNRMSLGAGSGGSYLQTFLTYRNVGHLERGILVELVNAVYIHENGRVEIEFNFADQHMRILEFIEANVQEQRLKKKPEKEDGCSMNM